MSKSKASPELNLWGEPFEEHQHLTPSLIPLDFEGHEVRIETVNGLQHWYGTDVCRSCEIDNPSQAYSRLDEDEKLTLISNEGGGQRSYVLLNEAGVFNLILTSRKPEAKRFKRWLTHEVLPALRRTGSYSITSSPVTRTAKRLKCDVLTAAKRVENKDVNKASHGRIASQDGACPRVFQDWHNGRYRGLTGHDARGLRKILEIKSGHSPLDHSSLLVVVANSHATALAMRIAEEKSIPLVERGAFIQRLAREIMEADAAKFGEGYSIGVRDDSRRGKVLDYIPRSISKQA